MEAGSALARNIALPLGPKVDVWSCKPINLGMYDGPVSLLKIGAKNDSLVLSAHMECVHKRSEVGRMSLLIFPCCAFLWLLFCDTMGWYSEPEAVEV